MEEKVNNSKEEKQEVKKLSYEQLEGVARQISAQLDYVTKENQQLRTVLQQERLENMFTELKFKFKVLEFANFFKPVFVEGIVKNIEEIMTPSEPEETDNKE